MTEPATARRPSPRPRPADEPPHLRIVPPTLQPETATSPDVPCDQETPGQDHAGHATFPAQPLQISGFRAFAARCATYWTPPEIFTDQPASLQDLADYARHAPWTHQNTGLLRAAGIGYYRAVSYPYTVVSRYREWVMQRPGRLLLHLGGLKLLAHTSPGMWAVDHLIYPAAQIVGHVFL